MIDSRRYVPYAAIKDVTIDGDKVVVGGETEVLCYLASSTPINQFKRVVDKLEDFWGDVRGGMRQ